jgi:hypothetical protein
MTINESIVIISAAVFFGREHKVSLEAKENVAILVYLYVFVIYVEYKRYALHCSWCL